MSFTKPETDIARVHRVLQRHWDGNIGPVTPIEGGNLSRAYYVDYDGKPYVVRFSNMQDAYRTEQFIANLLSSQGVPYPQIVLRGVDEELIYAVSERIAGTMIADVPRERKPALLPDLLKLVTRMNQVNVELTSGYGWIRHDGKGMYDSWERYIVSFYGEDQPAGSFWEGWHDLFRTTYLERGVVEEIYARMLHYAPYNAQHRHFVHNDCHAWNILSDGSCITGIIDGNCIYGDSMIDISIAEGVIPGVNTVQAVRDEYARLGLDVPDFDERMLGARYYKGLDGLRFYAKMDRKKAYDHLRNYLIGLES